MSGSIDIGFGGSGGGASAGGNATFSTLTVGAGPYATTGDIRGGGSFSIYSATANQRVVGLSSGNMYFGDSVTQTVNFSTYGAGLAIYPTGIVSSAILTFGGQLQAVTQTVQTTSPAAGGGGALPATPKGYWQINLNGANQLLPYY